MTISSETRVAGPYAGTGSVATFPFGFKVFQSSDLQVIRTDTAVGEDTLLDLGADYTVLLNSDQDASPGGSVTLLSGALEAGINLTVTSSVPYLQPVDITNQGGFYPRVIMSALDRLTILCQQLYQKVSRSLQMSVSLPDGVQTTLPPPVAQSVIGWDASGASLKNYPLSDAGVMTDTSVASNDSAGGSLWETVAGFISYLRSFSGSGLIGFDPTLSYVSGTIGAILQDNAVNVMAFLSQTERAQVKSGGVAIDLTPKINAAKTWAGNRPLYFPAGTWSLTSFNGKGWYGGLIGDGMTQTLLKVRAPVATAFDFAETSDVAISPFLIKGMTIDGDAKATTLVDVRYRHHYVMEDLVLSGATSVNLNEKDTWLGTHRNCRFTSAPTLVYLRGSNHRSAFYGCAFTANTVWQLRVESNGTALDGNDALLFSNCDFEFSGTAGAGIYFDGTSATFDTCYMGENIEGEVLRMVGGNVLITGGVLFFGYTLTSYGINCLNAGAKCRFKSVRVNGQTNGGFATLITAPATLNLNVVSFQECTANMLTGGNQTIPGDPLDYGPAALCFTRRSGRAYSVSNNNVTTSISSVNNEVKATVLTAPGPSPLVSINTTTNNLEQCRAGEMACLVIVYASTKPVNFYLSNAAFGGNYLLVSAPATAGAITTAIKVDIALPTTAYGVFEGVLQNAAVGDTFTLYEAFFADARFLDKGSSFGNLYKF